MKIRVLLVLVLGVVALFGLGGCPARGSEDGAVARGGDGRPNVVVILLDDLGWSDVGFMGVRDDVLTPNIDRLAEGGAIAREAYTTSSQCAPSRAGLMTGGYQQRFGVDENKRTPAPATVPTLGERLRDAGYATGFVGKWNLGARKVDERYDAAGRTRFLPGARGFDESLNFDPNAEDSPDELRGYWSDAEPGRSRAMTAWALDFVERAERPFGLVVSYSVPHHPIVGPADLLDQFPDSMDPTRRGALAMLLEVDEGVGRLIERLESRGEVENTLIFLVSDNGPHLGEGESLLEESEKWNGSLAEPLRGGKATLFEGGVRTPFVVHWPKAIEGGTEISGLVSTLDITPTVLEAVGVSDSEGLDGVSLLPFVQGGVGADELESRTLYWREFGQAAIRVGDEKYLEIEDGRRYLFDLSSDPGEVRNLVATRAARAAWMRGALEEWTNQMERPGMFRDPLPARFFDPHDPGAEVGNDSPG